MRKLFLLPLIALSLCACNSDPKVENRQVPPTQTEYRSDVKNVDNTGINVRDRDNAHLTSGNQSENKNDLNITQVIRQMVVKDNALSTDAKNIKIITINGVVTLRGPVNSAEERASIAQKAKDVQGVARVDNQLEVIKPNLNK